MNPARVEEMLSQFMMDVERIGKEDGLLGAPDHYRRVIVQEVSALASRLPPTAAEETEAVHNQRAAQHRLIRAEAGRQACEAPLKPAPVSSIRTAVSLGGAAGVAIGAALLVAPGPVRDVLVGGSAVLWLALLWGSAARQRIRRWSVERAVRRAEAAVDRAEQQASALANQRNARQRWIERSTARCDDLYLFYRWARGALAAEESQPALTPQAGSQSTDVAA